jgi:hypothetical protein
MGNKKIAMGEIAIYVIGQYFKVLESGVRIEESLGSLGSQKQL